MATKIKGELKIEFYAHLEEIQDLYFNQGIRIFKILHQKIVEKYDLTISYKMFCYYAKKELKVKSISNTQIPILQEELGANIEEKLPIKKDDVIIASPKFSKAKKFIPYSTDDT
jgi:hypothetical protein